MIKPRVVAHVHNHCAYKVKARRPKVQNGPQLHTPFEASLDYMGAYLSTP